jgi:hypothetical protein
VQSCRQSHATHRYPAGQQSKRITRCRFTTTRRNFS